MAMENSPNNSIPKLKIVLLGDSGVGKTSLINQYVNKKFQQTLDIKDVLTKQVEMSDGKHVILRIQDTSGQERLGSGLEAAFFNNAKGCMLVYDVNDPKSFDNIESWHKEFITRAADPESFPFIVLGNKVDLLDGGKSRGVSERAIRWCHDKGSIYHLETSAKKDKNVVEAFQHIAELAINHVTKITVPELANPTLKPPSNQVTSNQTTLYQANSNQATSNRVTSNHASSNQANSIQATSNHASSNQATSNMVTSNHATSNEPNKKGCCPCCTII